MKATELKNLIKLQLDLDSRYFDHISAKEIQTKLLDNHQVKASIPIIIKVLMEIIQDGIDSDGGDGWICNDGSTFTWADENGVGDSKLRGLHKYWFFNT